MDPVNTALTLVQSLCKRAEDVRSNEDDCKQLAEFAKRTVPLLEHLSTHSATDPGINQGLEAVVEALELADVAVTECCNSTAFVAVLYSDKIGDQLKKAASTLSSALSLLSTANVGLAAETQEEIFSLKEQLKNVHFSQAAAAREQVSELKCLLEAGFNTNAEASEEIKGMIERMLQNHSKTRDQQQADLEILKGCLADARINKERLEEFQLLQIIDAIEAGGTASQRQAKDASLLEEEEELISHLYCPISMERMTDPVLVKESGMTYDRASIQKWFERGHRNCPQTNIALHSMELIPNVVVRRQLNSVMKREGKSMAEASPPDPVDLPPAIVKPGFLEGRRRSNAGDDSDGVIYTLLLLDVSGNVLGVQASTSNTSQTRTRDWIVGGRWDQQSIEFHSAKHSGQLISVKGAFSIQPSSKGTVHCLRLTEKLPIFVTEASSTQATQQLIDLNCVEFEWVSEPPPLRHYVLGQGMVQMDGVIRRRGKEHIRNRLLLSLQGDGKVRGWLSVEAEKGASSFAVGKIDQGTWDDAESMLAFRLDFYNGQRSSDSELSERPLFRAFFSGEISNGCIATAGVNGPKFGGVCHIPGSASTDDLGELAWIHESLKQSADFEYTHFTVPPDWFALSPTKDMILMRPPPELGSIAGYAGPGVYKIKMEYCVDGRTEDPCVGKYLVATRHNRGKRPKEDLCCWIGWKTDPVSATLWEIKPSQADSSRVNIKLYQHPTPGFATNHFVTAHAWSDRDFRDEESVFAITHDGRLNDWVGSFSFEFYKGHIVAVIKNPCARPSYRRFFEAVLAAPDLTHRYDKLDSSTVSAIVHKDYDKAAGLSLLCVSRYD